MQEEQPVSAIMLSIFFEVKFLITYVGLVAQWIASG
jgi:hypothetical protein